MYSVELMPQAVKALKKLPKPTAKKIVGKITMLESGLAGDIKKLANFQPAYRLRVRLSVGDYRVLFEIEGKRIMIYHVKHRKDSYAKYS